MEQTRWWTTAEIAERLKVDEQTVRRWLRDGLLIGVRLSDRAGYRIEERDLVSFLKQRGWREGEQ